MGIVTFQTNAFAVLHYSTGDFWCASTRNYFYWCSFTLHKIFDVGRYIVQTVECHYANWTKTWLTPVAVKIRAGEKLSHESPAALEYGIIG